MKNVTALSILVIAFSAPGALAEVSGYWVKDKAQCQYRRGERYEVGIFGNTLTDLEFQCDMTSKSRQGSYTVAKAVCGGEGESSREVLRYRVDGKGALHLKIGTGPEQVYRYSCRN